MHASCTLPPIAIDSHDYTNLVLLAAIAPRSGFAYAPFLQAELRRAQLHSFENLPPSAVTMGARVTYRKNAVSVTRKLVFPSETDRTADALSIGTPEGIALLGLQPGDRMPFRSADGELSEVLVEHVEGVRDGVNSNMALDRRLDHALAETFPASDPVAVMCTGPEQWMPEMPIMDGKDEASFKPRIIVSEIDQRRLTTLAEDALRLFPEVAEELLREMDRADVAPANSMPPNVVRMGSRVFFQPDRGAARRATLVFPGQANIERGKISILTPIGAALIGLSEGQSIAWRTRDGQSRSLTVLSVEPPEETESS